MAQLAMCRPLDERNLHDDFGSHPVCANARESFALREWGVRDFEVVQPSTKFQQQFRVEARADFTGEDEIIPIEVAYEQRAETDAAALRIRESADDEFLSSLALHLQPMRRAAVLVR